MDFSEDKSYLIEVKFVAYDVYKSLWISWIAFEQAQKEASVFYHGLKRIQNDIQHTVGIQIKVT